MSVTNNRIKQTAMSKARKKMIAPIDCDEAAKRFNDFLDNYIKGRAREELMHHIADCRHCFERVEFEQLLKSKISSIGKTINPDEIDAKQHFDKIISKIFNS